MAESKQTTTNSSNRPILIGCGIGAVVLVLLCLIPVAAFLIWLTTSPEGGVRMSNELEVYALDYIADHDLLNESEQIIAYYDSTLTLDGSEAAILTTERILYHKDGRNTAMELKDIVDVQHRYEGLSGDIIEVIGDSGQRLKIEIAPLNGGTSFLNALLDAWEASK